MAGTNTTSAPGWAVVGLVAGLSPLDQVEATLRLLCTGPAPLVVNGRRIGGGLPRRRILVVELASVLAHPSCGQEAKRRVWRLLVGRARSGQPGWVLAAVGVALPGLRRAASRLGHTRNRADVEADLIVGFLAAIGEVDTGRPGVCGRLVNAAHTHARSVLRAQEAAASGEVNFAPGSAMPPPPCGHPDVVLARAVRSGVVTHVEAELIGATRLEETTVAAWADSAGWTRKAAYERRSLAEARLVAAISAGRLSDPDAEVITEATGTVVAERIPAPRHGGGPSR
jgi:hypothetical protein